MGDFIPTVPVPEPQHGFSETAVQGRTRMNGSAKGMLLMRNNSGAFKDSEGRWIRYGLANDSKRVNEHIKSSDLIGIEPVTIGPQHVGSMLGRFVALECKPGNWKYTGTAREEAQLRFITIVTRYGGRAKFINDGEQV